MASNFGCRDLHVYNIYIYIYNCTHNCGLAAADDSNMQTRASSTANRDAWGQKKNTLQTLNYIFKFQVIVLCNVALLKTYPS